MAQTPDINTVIGLRVGYLRRREGLTQYELAKRIVMSRIMVSNVESGRVPLKLYAAWAISYGLLVHPNFLYYGGDDSQHFPVLDNEDFVKLDKIYRANEGAVFSETWEAMGGLLFDAEQKYRLTSSSLKSNNADVQSEIQKLMERVKRKSSMPGAKADLARKLGVAPARISEWLSGAKEPGGDYTLRLLRWVSQQEGLIK